MLAVNLAAPAPEAPLAAQGRLPPASEVLLAVKQKQLLMAGLAFSSESTPADKPKAVPPSPRSDRRRETLNV